MCGHFFSGIYKYSDALFLKVTKRFMNEVLPFYALTLMFFFFFFFHPFLSLIENVHKCDFLRGPGDKKLRGNQIVTASLVTSSARPGT